MDKKRPVLPDFYEINGCEYISKSLGNFKKSPCFKQIMEYNDFILFKLNCASGIEESTALPSAAVQDTNQVYLPDNAIPVNVGSGVVLEAFSINNEVISPGDTVTGSFWWSLENDYKFGLPLMWTIRFDTDYTKGAFYRKWYGKQYRRMVERSNNTFYRFTVSKPLKGEGSYPDIWKVGEIVNQKFTFMLPEVINPGNFRIRIKVWAKSYLPNRILSDYMSNDDSVQGEFIRDIFIVKSTEKTILPER